MEEWNSFRVRAIARLARLARRRVHHLAPLFEIEDLAEEAFFHAAQRIHSFESWPQFWLYSKKVALALISRRRSRLRPPCGAALARVEDPSGEDFIGYEDMEDYLQVRFSQLSREELQVLRTLLDPELNLKSAAESLHVSLSTLKRRRKCLRSWLETWVLSDLLD